MAAVLAGTGKRHGSKAGSQEKNTTNALVGYHPYQKSLTTAFSTKNS